MKKKCTLRSAFFSQRGLIALFLIGAYLVLFAIANLQALTQKHATRSDPSSLTPSGVVQEAWVARYDGPGDCTDEARAIAVDNTGSVYITGESDGSGTGDDYATVKYNSAGQQQWVARYNGPGNDDDAAVAIALDSSDNVYVTGASIGTTYPNSDYATIKYNSAGQQQWVARYNGPGNYIDEATAIAVDTSSNVYVTGRSFGSGGNFDYATIKYNSAGHQQWIARYDGPGNSNDEATGIVVDVSGSVYVTGKSTGSGGDSDYATIKYNSAGQQQWVARYDGSGHGDDYATAIAIDNSGNVYVTGTSYDSNTIYDYATIKYDSAGQQQWAALYNGPGNIDDEATAISVDDSGNVYVTGWSLGENLYYDYATVKYNSAGQEQWVARYNGPGNEDDRANAIAHDSSGNAYVTGWSSGLDDFRYNYVTIKYSETGQEQWVARYDGPGGGNDYANAIAIDASANVYVTGGSDGLKTCLDYATIKYVQGPTPSPTPTPTPTASPSPTATPTPTPTPTPCTGRCAPTPRPRPTRTPRP
jgi:uncharacterized delta-60 repeat protein